MVSHRGNDSSFPAVDIFLPPFDRAKGGRKPDVQRVQLMAALGKISLRENFLDSSRGKIQIRVSGRAISANTPSATRDLSKIGGVPANVDRDFPAACAAKRETAAVMRVSACPSKKFCFTGKKRQKIAQTVAFRLDLCYSGHRKNLNFSARTTFGRRLCPFHCGRG